MSAKFEVAIGLNVIKVVVLSTVLGDLQKVEEIVEKLVEEVDWLEAPDVSREDGKVLIQYRKSIEIKHLYNIAPAIVAKLWQRMHHYSTPADVEVLRAHIDCSGDVAEAALPLIQSAADKAPARVPRNVVSL